jgi:CBS domain containing-hemolysin-like protein
MLELIGAVLLLIIASALCSGTEAAIFSLPITKARQMAEKGRTGRTVCDIREHPARPISVIVILNNLANIVGTYFIAALATSRLEGVWATAFPFLLTAAVILLSEILPKTIGERYHAKIAWFMARPLYWATFLMTPIVWGIELFTGFLVRHRGNIATTSENEIKALVRIGEQEGVIEDDERNLISRVFEMNDKTAYEIMTPRTALTWIRGIEPISVAKDKIGTSQHSRIVVVGETLDDVKGIIHKSTILRLLVDGYDENALVEDHTETVNFFHEETPTDDLLEHFKSSRVHLAVVLDDYGGLSGIVTLEDVLEVLTGEIVDETDRHTDMQQVALKKGKLRLKKEREKNGIVIEKPEGNAVRVTETRNGETLRVVEEVETE